MAYCRICTAPITWARIHASEDRVPLDDHEQRDYGPGRYRITVDGNPPAVLPIAEDSPARSFVDHRVICQEPRVVG